MESLKVLRKSFVVAAKFVEKKLKMEFVKSLREWKVCAGKSFREWKV